MRVVSLHPDVLVVTSALLHLNCVIVLGAAGRGGGAAEASASESSVGGRAGAPLEAEAFVIDSPVLPDELDALPAMLEQAGFPAPSGLLATHGDWDHLLGRLAFPSVALGVAQSTAARLVAEPGAAQRELRAFDEEIYVERRHPLALGSVQALPVPGRCGIGGHELELHAAGGHTVDGMAIRITWAKVLVVGDYLSTVEIPTLTAGGDPDAYLATLARLRPFVQDAEHVVPGHGPVLNRDRALAVLDEDVAYLRALCELDVDAALPAGRDNRAQRRLHARNVARQAS
ncbi:MAG TPA: MBL fold metallo-hydrolase [Solirubrobacteraceae bacterium]|nr:MBL fold metallo-hydrolase [Solirubrobacteraceae bacterium]